LRLILNISNMGASAPRTFASGDPCGVPTRGMTNP
jgi:hypothetical protein